MEPALDRGRPATALPLRAAAPAWVALLLAASLAWRQTLAEARCMQAMDTRGATMGLAAVPFIVMWTSMMAAMMLPSVGPVASVWAQVIARAPCTVARAWRTVAFVLGYLLAWSISGLAAFALCASVDAALAPRPGAARWMGTGIWLAAGAWQLGPWKELCLRHCRSPFAALVRYAAFRGVTRDLRVGLHHGLHCIGCCFGLMLVLVATGVMNLPAMVGLTTVVFLEKVWRHGQHVGRAAGFVLIGTGLAAPWTPALWSGLATAP